MVNLNDESEVERKAREHHLSLMYRYQQDLEREGSMRAARQGNRPVYREFGPHSYFIDRARSALYGDVDAELEKRLLDYRSQAIVGAEKRAIDDVNASGGGDFVPPAWLETIWIEAAHPGCPLGAAAVNRPLPPGTDSIVVPGFLTSQNFSTLSSQNTQVPEQSGYVTTGTITLPVVSVLAQTTLSRQLIDQAPRDIDSWLGLDSAAAYAAEKTSLLYSGTGSSGQPTGVLNWPNVLTVSAGGSTAGFWSGIAAAQAAVLNNLYLPPNVAFISVADWQWVSSTVDESGRPFLMPHTQTPDSLVRVPTESLVAQFNGLSLVVDPALPAGNVVVARSSELALFEGPLQFLVQREYGAQDLSVTVTSLRYLAFGVRRPSGVCVVSFTPTYSGS
jgi:HK97 family phage major capsid protein